MSGFQSVKEATIAILLIFLKKRAINKARNIPNPGVGSIAISVPNENPIAIDSGLPLLLRISLL
jgi:hypothetical protein